MNKINASKNIAGMLKLEDFAKKYEVSQAHVMVMAGKERQKRNSTAFKNHYVRVNSKGELFLIHPDMLEAFR